MESSSSQEIQQLLSSLLSQRGPSALPYTEDTKWLIRNHLVALTNSYPSLEPKTASFTHNDGRSVNLLQVDGTIPMHFNGVTYNIPVIIWLMETYPRHSPRVYVNPTRDMVIKRPHNHVNPSGLVSIPYLQNWIYPSYSLVDLVRNLSSTFARDPPLYAQRRTTTTPSPTPTPTPSPSPSFGSVGQSEYPRPPQPAAIHQVYPAPSPPYGGVGRAQTDLAADVYKRNVISKIMDMANGDIMSLRKTIEAEMEGLFSTQTVLRRREQDFNRGLKEMQDENERLEAQLQIMLMNIDVLEAWVKDNEGKAKKESDFDVDKVFECSDGLSKQMHECSAADLAIEDVVYALDKAVQEGAVPFSQYLRSVRLLSREQFFHRATATKIRDAQMQAQVATMSIRDTQLQAQVANMSVRLANYIQN